MRNLMGREPSPEVVARAERKYLTHRRLLAAARDDRARSPTALAATGSRQDGPRRRRSRVGMRYWDPTIADALDGLVADGAARIVQLSLSPFESGDQLGRLPRRRGRGAGGAPGRRGRRGAVVLRRSPASSHALADGAARGASRPRRRRRPLVVFTAHSLPGRGRRGRPALRRAARSRRRPRSSPSVGLAAPVRRRPRSCRASLAFGHAGDRAVAVRVPVARAWRRASGSGPSSRT